MGSRGGVVFEMGLKARFGAFIKAEVSPSGGGE